MEFCEKGSLERAVNQGRFIRRADKHPELVGLLAMILPTDFYLAQLIKEHHKRVASSTAQHMIQLRESLQLLYASACWSGAEEVHCGSNSNRFQGLHDCQAVHMHKQNSSSCKACKAFSRPKARSLVLP